MVQVTLVSQDPDPVEPGEIVKVKFKVENTGRETEQEAIVRVLPKYPFTTYGISEKNIGRLRASSTGADAEVVEFELKVDSNAVERESGIGLEVQFADTAIRYTNDELKINVQTRDAILDIVSIDSNPKQIAPGEIGEVTILVKNQADSLLTDIKFRLDL